MVQLAAKHKLLIFGILIGVVYGLATRMVWGQQMALASLTYLFLIPTVLGIIPFVFADDDQVRSYRNIIFVPWVTVLSFFVVMWLLHIENLICLIILGAPFLVLGTVGALIYRLIRIRRKKRTALSAFAFFILPALVAPIEHTIATPSDVYSVMSEVVVNAPADTVWRNIVRVPRISEGEFHPGVFNYLGVPRPIEAELAAGGIGALRKGHFENGLIFIEHIQEWQPDRNVLFDITVDPDTLSDRIFDQHVLKGNYFSFVEAGYEIEPLGGTQIRLRLTSRYRLTSKVNFYGKFWGDIFLRDFQDRLLAVIRSRCEG